jgi:hypothetical protein
MGWQEWSALTLVAGTVAAFAWGRVRRKKVLFGRHGLCNCASESHVTKQGSIVFRARRGERTEVAVKIK